MDGVNTPFNYYPTKWRISFSFSLLHFLSSPHFPVQIKTQRLHTTQPTQAWNLHSFDSKTFPPPKMPTLLICVFQKKQKIPRVFRSRPSVRNDRTRLLSWAAPHGDSRPSQATVKRDRNGTSERVWIPDLGDAHVLAETTGTEVAVRRWHYVHTNV